jgi:hypothetical protein
MSAYLHRHYSVVYCYLLRQEVGPNCCFVACAELLVDLYRGVLASYSTHSGEGLKVALRKEGCRHTYWFIRLVLPTPLSPRIMTCRCPNQYCDRTVPRTPRRTFNRTFFLDDMVLGPKCYCLLRSTAKTGWLTVAVELVRQLGQEIDGRKIIRAW